MNIAKTSSALNSINGIWDQIDVIYKQKLFILLILMLMTSCMELASIGALIPFIHALLNPDALFRNEYLGGILNFFYLSRSENILLPMTVAFSLMAIFSRVFSLVSLNQNLKVAYLIGSDLSCRAYYKTLHQPYEIHISRNTSVIANAISGRISNVIAAINYCLTITASLITIIIIAIGLILMDPGKTSAVIIFGLLFYITISIYGKKLLIDNGRTIAIYTNKMILSLQQGLGGIRDVLIDSSQLIFYKNFEAIDRVLRRTQGKNQIAASAPKYVIELFGMLLIIWVAYFTARSNRNSFEIVASLGVLIFSAQKLLPSFQQIYAAWSGLLGGIASVQEVLNLLNQAAPKIDNNLLKLAGRKSCFKQEIRLRNVSFSYKNSIEIVFNGINISIIKGERLGVIGRSGAGKSTFLDLLMGLLLPTSGGMFIDGILIDESNRADWMSVIAHVPQSIYLTDGTILENIAFGVEPKNIDMGRIQDVASKAQILSFISKLDYGYETRIGEKGVLLSGGQRQRLGIARALYKGAELLILDEATSALDDETEAQIMSDINSLSREITLIIVAHRATTLLGCDRIVRVENGNLADFSY